MIKLFIYINKILKQEYFVEIFCTGHFMLKLVNSAIEKKHKYYFKYKFLRFIVILYELRIYPLNKGLITTLTATQFKNYLF